MILDISVMRCGGKKHPLEQQHSTHYRRLVMSVQLPTYDTLAESSRLIEVLERCCAEFPLAKSMLDAHRPAHSTLETSTLRTQQALEAWRSALATRWQYEVKARRIYRQGFDLLREHLGPDTPELRLVSRGGAEVNSLPEELVADLRRLHSAMALWLPASDEREQLLNEVSSTSDMLETAIEQTNECERDRRVAMLERRIAQQRYRRIRAKTRKTIAENYGHLAYSQVAEILL
jgi:hypothetical protein